MRNASEIVEIKQKLTPPLSPTQMQDISRLKSQEKYFHIHQVNNYVNSEPVSISEAKAVPDVD